MNTELWVDKIGQVIEVGDEIVYAVRYGNRGALQTGTVLEYVEGGLKVLGCGNSRAGVLEYPDRIAVIKKGNQ